MDIFDILVDASNPYANGRAMQNLFRNAGLGRERIAFSINQTDLLAPTVQHLVAPFTGWVTDMVVMVQVAITTGGTLTLKNGSTAITNAVVTLANSATVGTVKQASLAGTPFVFTADTTAQCNRGDNINITPASFASAGAVTGWVEFQPRGATG